MIQKSEYQINRHGVQTITFFEEEGTRHLVSYNAGSDVVLEAELFNVPDKMLDEMTFQDLLKLMGQDEV